VSESGGQAYGGTAKCNHTWLTQGSNRITFSPSPVLSSLSKCSSISLSLSSMPNPVPVPDGHDGIGTKFSDSESRCVKPCGVSIDPAHEDVSASSRRIRLPLPASIASVLDSLKNSQMVSGPNWRASRALSKGYFVSISSCVRVESRRAERTDQVRNSVQSFQCSLAVLADYQKI
jgi:hypothetical protein